MPYAAEDIKLPHRKSIDEYLNFKQGRTQQSLK